jgi:hypothetical protein
MRKTIAIALLVVPVLAFGARDSGGTYSRPSGNPVTTGTPITSTWANSLTADFATELTDSLSRSGKGGMTAPLRCADGTASLPAFSWTSDTNTGFYRIGADNVGLSLGGTKKVDFAATGTTVTGDIDASGDVGAATATITGNATVGGTLGVTGAATLSSTLGVVGNATLSGGDLYLTKSGTQTIRKDSGALNILMNGGGNLTIQTAAGYWTFNQTTGDLSAPNGTRISNLNVPTGSTDAATKGYVDGTDCTISPGSNWDTPFAAFCRKVGGLASIYIRIAATNASAAWTSVATLPAGYRPTVGMINVPCAVGDFSPAAPYMGWCSVGTDGVISATHYDDGTSMNSTMFTIAGSDYVRLAVSFPVTP